MQYVGSKNRLSKELVPIIQSYISDKTEYYIEPFVGGCNVIDKVKCRRKVGIDIHEELIELLKYAQTNELPITFSEEEYHKVKEDRGSYPKWYVGLVGFCGSFGAKYFGGFARRYNKDGSLFDVPQQAINSLRRQSKNKLFKDIQLVNSCFQELNPNKVKNSVIYCDPPYLISGAVYQDGKRGFKGWSPQDDKDLYKLLDNLNDSGMKFALSNMFSSKGRNNDYLIEWADKYNTHFLKANYNGSNYQRVSNGKDVEVLITNY